MHGEQQAPVARSATQIEALQSQLSDLEREANKEKAKSAALEHSCQQEEADLEARRKRQQDLAEEIERQSEKQQQLQEKNGDLQNQQHELIATKRELDQIEHEARKHRDTTGSALKKMRTGYENRLKKQPQLQEAATSLKRRTQAGLGGAAHADDERADEKKQTLRDTIAQLQTDIESERGNDANHSIKQAIELEKQNEQSSLAALEETKKELALTEAKIAMKASDSKAFMHSYQDLQDYEKSIDDDIGMLEAWIKEEEEPKKEDSQHSLSLSQM